MLKFRLAIYEKGYSLWPFFVCEEDQEKGARVYDLAESSYRYNYYTATALVRINDMGLFLYDIINIKKEARKPTDH